VKSYDDDDDDDFSSFLIVLKYNFYTLQQMHKVSPQRGGCFHPSACFISKATERISIKFGVAESTLQAVSRI
jgi:hypothetical protein